MNFMILGLCILFGASAQLFMKKSVMGRDFFTELKKVILGKWIWLGGICYVVSNVLWIVVLSRMELSYAYPIVSLNYFLVAFLSYLLFNEKVSERRWLSIAIIILGVIIVGLS